MKARCILRNVITEPYILFNCKTRFVYAYSESFRALIPMCGKLDRENGIDLNLDIMKPAEIKEFHGEAMYLAMICQVTKMKPLV